MTDQARSARIETRVSAVLYGGVSLAVYISGSCQELLSVVRATADQPLVGATRAEAVYRQLAEHAGEHRQPMKVTVDVISGSSAGGLNAIFLGKALTHGGSLDGLTEIWRSEADFLRLLNDPAAGQPDGVDIPIPTRPTSILNSDRFFLLLFDALERMDEEAEAAGVDGNRLVDAVDCYLTTTDLRGVAERVQLHRNTVTELRHRGRFRFQDGVRSPSGLPYGDLGRDKNHLLAFAARATAAHPGAFHPAQWEQVMSLPMKRAVGAIDPSGSILPNRSPFGEVPVERRWYSDGGVMDNKPFAYALEPLVNRRANVPVDRRVVYVEPDPNTSVDGWQAVEFPPLSQYTAKTYGMARAENIREDVAAMNVRNAAVARLTESVKVLFERPLSEIEEVLRATTGADENVAPKDLPLLGLDDNYAREATTAAGIVGSWTNSTRAEHAATRGWGAVAAEEFRWSSVVKDLVVTSLQIGEQAPDAALIGKVTSWVRPGIEEWIRRNRSAHVNTSRTGLYLFDVGYRLRRFTLLEHLLSDVQRRLNAGEPSAEGVSSPEVRFEQCRRARRAINELYLELRSKVDEQQTVDFQRVLGVDASDWGEDGPHFEELLQDPRFPASLDGLITELQHRMSLPLRQASERGRKVILDAEIDDDLRLRLTDAWLNYGDYDQLILPLSEIANSELDAAQVIRISPVDADALIDEGLGADGGVGTDGQPLRRRKLGGNALAHFGGFLDANWRLNDILWGRLDAAEIIVKSILVHPDDNPTEAIAEIHRAILRDLAEAVARGAGERSPLLALLKVNRNNHTAAHDRAGTELARCARLQIAEDDSELTSEQQAVIEATASSFEALLRLDASADEPSWSIDLSMDDARSSRGQRKIELLQRGSRVAGKILELADEDHYRIDSGERRNRPARTNYAALGRFLVSAVMLAIGGQKRRIALTGVLAAAGAAGLVATVVRADDGAQVVGAMVGAAFLALLGSLISQTDTVRAHHAVAAACSVVALGLVVAGFVINWLAASASVMFITLVGLAIAFWSVVGMLRKSLITLGNQRPAPPPT